MGIMKHDMNFIFFVLIVVTLASFAWLTVYYQGNFRNVSVNYDTKLLQLEKVTKELQQHKAVLNKTSYQLQVKEKSVEDFDSKYTQIRAQKEQLEADKKNLEAELTKTKSELVATKQSLLTTQTELSNTKTELDAKKTEISSLTSELHQCNVDKTYYKANWEACQAS